VHAVSALHIRALLVQILAVTVAEATTLAVYCTALLMTTMLINTTTTLIMIILSI
jgi:hypothetical protein